VTVTTTGVIGTAIGTAIGGTETAGIVIGVTMTDVTGATIGTTMTAGGTTMTATGGRSGVADGMRVQERVTCPPYRQAHTRCPECREC